ISSRLTIRMPLSLRRKGISQSRRSISSRLTIRMPLSLRRRRISRKARQCRHRSQNQRLRRKR
ncbi:DNA translocase ftsK, partial [Klebsiella variicola]